MTEQPSTPPEAPPPAEAPPPQSPPELVRPKLDWRIIAALAAALVIVGVIALAYVAMRPRQDLAQPGTTAPAAEENVWSGLAGYDRLLVRPVSIPRPVMGLAMENTLLSGYADVDFTVGANGKAADIHVVRESTEDIGYAQEARRLVAAATWPTEWRGRAAPYAARYRVIFPPGRSSSTAIAPISIASPNLTEEILALRRNANVTLLVRVTPEGLVQSAQVVETDVQSAAVTAEAMRVAMGARFPENAVAYETRLLVRFDVLGALGGPEPAPAGPAVSLSDVPFAQRPSASDFSRHYPDRALRAGISGRVTLDCTVRRDLRLSCLIASEDPPNEGFGNAALRISRRFRAEDRFPDGRPTVGAQVTVPMSFRVE